MSHITKIHQGSEDDAKDLFNVNNHNIPFVKKSDKKKRNADQKWNTGDGEEEQLDDDIYETEEEEEKQVEDRDCDSTDTKEIESTPYSPARDTGTRQHSQAPSIPAPQAQYPYRNIPHLIPDGRIL
jgi:hypothetical protein